MGHCHALNFLRLVPRANILCACSPVQEELNWADENLVPYGVKVFSTFEEMIEMPGLEAVIICSATPLHVPHTIAALDRGIQVLCEKPISKSVSEMRALLERADANSKASVMVAFTRRFDESYRDAYLKIKAGAIGTPIIFRSHGVERMDDSPFSHQYLKNSGGIFVDSAIHDIDLALMFLGEDSVPKSVSAVGVSTVFSELEEVDDADNAVAVCEFWDGKIAHFYHSRTSAAGYHNASEIFGTAGKLSINLRPWINRVELCDGDGFLKVEPTPSWYDRYKSAFVIEANEWVAAVLDKKPLPIPLRSALTSLVIAQALQDSLRTGRKIEFSRDGQPKVPAPRSNI
ncbi:hypothetical protein QQX98_013226 [Neonectria punicea]|uniref:Uncharacterized protein n=1 Tax=Neonectria punicea TaxID=979145 RepID=A0ABR1GGX4_9HYPO